MNSVLNPDIMVLFSPHPRVEGEFFVRLKGT